MTSSLARPAHWDDPDPVPGFRLLRRRSDVGVGEVWDAVTPDANPVLVRLVDVADDAISRAKAGRLAGALPLLAHPDLEPVRQVVPTGDGLALIRPAAPAGVTTLSALLTRRRSLTAGETAGLGDRLGRGLGFLHDNGVTHGRLGAGDVLLLSTGRPMLTGFGVAGIQGAGGLPVEDIAALAALLLAMLSAAEAHGTAALRAVLTAAARDGADGHAFADEVLGSCDPAPTRLRPSPGRRLRLLPADAARSHTRSEGSTVPSEALGARSSAAPLRVPTSPTDTLDAAVRALRAGARQSSARHRGRPARKPADASAARQRPERVGPSRRRPVSRAWFVRAAPAAAILLVTVLVGWRFLGTSATADGRSVPGASTTASPDLHTIERLDVARAAVFAAGSAPRLTEADAPGSPALAADVDAMSIMLSHHGRARGLRPRLFTVTLLSRTGDRAVVRVVDELPPYDFVTPSGQIIARSIGHPRQAHAVRLRLVSGQWRYDAVTKPTVPGPSAGGAS